MNETLYYIGNKTGFMEVCELNQAKMLEATEKIAPTGYYIVLLGLLCLIFFFFIQPRLKETIKDSLLHYVGLLGTCLVFLGCWVLAMGVFQIGEAQLIALKRFTSFLIVPLLILVGYVLYRRYKGW